MSTIMPPPLAPLEKRERNDYLPPAPGVVRVTPGAAQNPTESEEINDDGTIAVGSVSNGVSNNGQTNTEKVVVNARLVSMDNNRPEIVRAQVLEEEERPSPSSADDRCWNIFKNQKTACYKNSKNHDHYHANGN